MNSKPASDVIMIIDDEPDNLNVLGEMLRREGVEVRAFPKGGMALAAARAEPPDLILLDIRMPEMDGYEVCRRFKEDERLRSIPVIFLSAFSEPSDKVRAFEAGGVDFVTKPFSEIEVLARMNNHLRLRRYQLKLEELVRQRVQELAEANRRLRIWDDAKNQWLNTLSHEMRTPLVGVFGITELLFMEVPTTSHLHEMRDAYDLSCQRINKLMDDALALVHMDVASEDFGRNPLALADMIRRALQAFARMSPTTNVQVSLTKIEEVRVSGDATLLERAFTDLLLTAACCACTGGPVLLETGVSEGQAEVLISFGKDPYTPEALETFFEVGGLQGGGDVGLMPALASRVLRLFNGDVSIRNGPERGLVITTVLPVG
jgi:two-component system sensor histidine kinase/response regulator